MIRTSRNAAFRLPKVICVLACLALDAPAAVITSSAVTLSPADTGKTFTVQFDGNVEQNQIPGLTASAEFTLDVFTSNMMRFNVSLADTSKLGIFSRVSAVGFDISDAVLMKADVTGLFSTPGYVLNGSFPNQFGDLDICFTNGNTCQGGGGGGLYTQQTGAFTASLWFDGQIQAVTLSDFGARYQSITGTPYGTSGTGQGFVTFDSPSVPEPGTATLALAGIVLIGLGARAFRRVTRQQSEQHPSASADSARE